MKRSLKPKTRRHVMIQDADWDFLDRRFGTGAAPGKAVGIGTAICQIVELYCNRLRAREQALLDGAQSAPAGQQDGEAG